MAICIGLSSDDNTLQPVLSSALGKDFQVRLATDEVAINRLLSAGSCDILILDLAANDKTSDQQMEFSQRVIASRGSAVIVVMADDTRRGIAAELVRLGAYGYVRRPPSIRDLKAMLHRAHENSSLKRELQNVQQRLEEVGSCGRMIGSSSSMQQIYDLVRRVANINASVLVTGESGTGKELIASAIHKLGNRSDRQFALGEQAFDDPAPG